ncbi:MAG: hypothetical protein LBJ71_01575 [Holosporaceae bacterium]|nr:hypothetical protein [Holosporaceae bacterium]
MKKIIKSAVLFLLIMEAANLAVTSPIAIGRTTQEEKEIKTTELDRDEYNRRVKVLDSLPPGIVEFWERTNVLKGSFYFDFNNIQHMEIVCQKLSWLHSVLLYPSCGIVPAVHQVDITPIAKNFKRLKVLHLADLGLEVKYVGKVIDSIAELEELEGNIDSFAKLTKLKCLHLTCPNLIGDISVFTNFPDLRVLTLGCKRVSGDISSVENLQKLEKLVVCRGFNLTGSIDSLAKLTNLEELHLYDFKITGNVTSLQNLQKLKELFLGDCANLTGDISVLEAIRKKNHE